jgi:hypothetical protein
VVDWPILLGGILGLVPALLILLASYAPYDGRFKDNVLFLFFMGGVFSGMAVALFEALLKIPRGDTLYLPIVVLLGFPILEQLLKLLVLNRRAHQGQRETVFYGGAFGLGFASMAVLSASQRDVPLLPYREIGAVLREPLRGIEFLVVAFTLLLAHFATGIVVGDGVRSRKLGESTGLAVVALIPVQFLVFEFSAGVLAGRESEGLIYLPLMLAYAVGLAWWAHSRVLPRALPPEDQRKRRRMLMRERREQDEGSG